MSTDEQSRLNQAFAQAVLNKEWAQATSALQGGADVATPVVALGRKERLPLKEALMDNNGPAFAEALRFARALLEKGADPLQAEKGEYVAAAVEGAVWSRNIDGLRLLNEFGVFKEKRQPVVVTKGVWGAVICAPSNAECLLFLFDASDEPLDWGVRLEPPRNGTKSPPAMAMLLACAAEHCSGDELRAVVERCPWPKDPMQLQEAREQTRRFAANRIGAEKIDALIEHHELSSILAAATAAANHNGQQSDAPALRKTRRV